MRKTQGMLENTGSIENGQEEEKFSFQVFPNNIIHCQFKDKVELTLEDAELYIQRVLELCNKKPYGMILDSLGRYPIFDPEARRRVARSPELMEFRVAQAILVNNLPLRLIANFYVRFEDPGCPVKIFSSLEKGKNWLSDLLVKMDQGV